MAGVDDDILKRIDELVNEEHRLQNTPDETAPERLRALAVRLDQGWARLRPRRARRDAGLDPSEAKVRDANVVEGYQQ